SDATAPARSSRAQDSTELDPRPARVLRSPAPRGARPSASVWHASRMRLADASRMRLACQWHAIIVPPHPPFGRTWWSQGKRLGASDKTLSVNLRKRALISAICHRAARIIGPRISGQHEDRDGRDHEPAESVSDHAGPPSPGSRGPLSEGL